MRTAHNSHIKNRESSYADNLPEGEMKSDKRSLLSLGRKAIAMRVAAGEAAGKSPEEE